jgi:conjugative relaxase-like TrwC/TraI family protein
MLTIAILSLASLAYYLGLTSVDYFFKGGEPPGKWFGDAAKVLGLTGIIEKEDLSKIFRGFHPRTDEPLVQNADEKSGRRKRRPAWDLTFSAPKTASCMITTKLWSSVRTLHDEAVHKTMEFLQKTRAVTRVGSVSKGDWRFELAMIMAALFEHSVSRELDPQLHTHALLANMCVTEDGEFRSLHSPPFFGNRQRHFLGAYYRAQFAYDLRTELKLETYREGTSFDIRGIPEELVKFWSKRRIQIKKYLKKNGEKGGAAAAKAALETRRTKEDIPPRKEILERWKKEARSHGMTSRVVDGLQRAKPRNHEDDLPKALNQSLKNMYRNGVSHFSEIDLRIEVLQEAVNWGLPPDMILEGVDKLIKDNEKLVCLGEYYGETRFTTRKILKREKQLLANTKALRHAKGPIADLKLIKKVLAKYPKMNEEQRRAVEHLTRSPGRFRLMDGQAGTGKTSMVLKASKEIWEQMGLRVVGAAPTGKAAVELQEATGIPTDTIHRHLVDFKKSLAYPVKHHLKQLYRAVRGKRTYRLKTLKPVKIDPKTIYVTDEMSMVDSRQWKMLTDLVRLGGGTFAGTGDGRQLPPVEGGAPFQSLCRRMGAAKLGQIVRQKEEWARVAAKLVSQGEAGQALAMYAERGLVNVGESTDEALEMLVRDWSVRGIKRPERAPILVSTNELMEKANDMCQAERLKAGVLNKNKSAVIVDEDENHNVKYQKRIYESDRVLFTKNDRRLGVRNGFMGTVLNVGRFGRSITVRLDSGQCVIIPVKDYKHLRLGYSITVYKAQGGTFVESYVLAGGGPQQDLPTSYVELTRSIHSTRIYTNQDLLDESLQDVEKSQLANQMSVAPDLSLASDLLDNLPPDESDKLLSKSKELPPLAKSTPWWEPKEKVAESEKSKSQQWNKKESQPKSEKDTILPERERVRKEHKKRKEEHFTAKRKVAKQEKDEQCILEQTQDDEERRRLLKQQNAAIVSQPMSSRKSTELTEELIEFHLHQFEGRRELAKEKRKHTEREQEELSNPPSPKPKKKEEPKPEPHPSASQPGIGSELETTKQEWEERDLALTQAKQEYGDREREEIQSTPAPMSEEGENPEPNDSTPKPEIDPDLEKAKQEWELRGKTLAEGKREHAKRERGELRKPPKKRSEKKEHPTPETSIPMPDVASELNNFKQELEQRGIAHAKAKHDHDERGKEEIRKAGMEQTDEERKRLLQSMLSRSESKAQTTLSPTSNMNIDVLKAMLPTMKDQEFFAVVREESGSDSMAELLKSELSTISPKKPVVLEPEVLTPEEAGFGDFVGVPDSQTIEVPYSEELVPPGPKVKSVGFDEPRLPNSGVRYDDYVGNSLPTVTPNCLPQPSMPKPVDNTARINSDYNSTGAAQTARTQADSPPIIVQQNNNPCGQ